MISPGLDKFTIFVTLLILIYILRPKINKNKQKKNNTQQKLDKPPSRITILIAKGKVKNISNWKQTRRNKNVC